MAVIINDFEIVPEPPVEAPEAGDRLAKADPTVLRPEDVIRILRREQLRRERVWAD